MASDSLPPLLGKKLLITSGPTRGLIDAVRFVSNRSSGKLGRLLAVEALRHGAQVTFIRGPGSRRPDDGALTQEALTRLALTEIETVDDLLAAARRLVPTGGFDAILHPMAVLDYVPATYDAGKTPSGRDEWIIRLIRTPKVIERLRELAPDAFLVEFKLEVGLSRDELVKAAHESLLRYRADLVVANDLTRIDAERHPAYFIWPDGTVERECTTKEEIAAGLVALIADQLRSRER